MLRPFNGLDYSTSNLNLSFSYTDRVKVHNVVDTQGKTQNIPITTGDSVMVLYFSKVSDGIYMILMENLGKRYYLKILKRK